MMKFLLIRFSSLGDCILLCPLADHLKRAGAEEVAVVTKSAYAALFAAATGVDRVVAIEPQGGAAALMRIAADHRDRGYCVIDAHNNLRSRLLSWRLGGADARFRKRYRERLGLILFKRAVRLPSIIDQYRALADAAGVPAPTLAPGGLDIPRRCAEAAADTLDDSATWVAIAPGARWPAKRWPAGHFVELSSRLARQRPCRILLVGDASDRAAAAPIAEDLGDLCVDITGRAELMESAAFISRCAGFVGNDSGLAHLSEAVGTPAAVLFGPTVEAFGYYPSLPRSKSIERELSCRPCSRNGGRPCPKRTLECLAGIAVDDVEKAVGELLDRTGPSRYVVQS